MVKTANGNKDKQSFLNDKLFKALTGVKHIKFLDGRIDDNYVTIKAKTSLSHAKCPKFKKISSSVHST